jgi:hypothetical protein
LNLAQQAFLTARPWSKFELNTASFFEAHPHLPHGVGDYLEPPQIARQLFDSRTLGEIRTQHSKIFDSLNLGKILTHHSKLF